LDIKKGRRFFRPATLFVGWWCQSPETRPQVLVKKPKNPEKYAWCDDEQKDFIVDGFLTKNKNPVKQAVDNFHWSGGL
jgi:hypothetical protein